MREIDVVALAIDLPERGLARGDRGTIVHEYGDGETFAVEFVDSGGRTLALVDLRSDQLREIDPGEARRGGDSQGDPSEEVSRDRVGLPEDLVPTVDELLFASHPLRAAKIIRERTGLGVRGACDLMYDRYNHLREVSPQRFDLTEQEYWSGWYS